MRHLTFQVSQMKRLEIGVTHFKMEQSSLSQSPSYVFYKNPSKHRLVCYKGNTRWGLSESPKVTSKGKESHCKSLYMEGYVMFVIHLLSVNEYRGMGLTATQWSLCEGITTLQLRRQQRGGGLYVVWSVLWVSWQPALYLQILPAARISLSQLSREDYKVLVTRKISYSSVNHSTFKKEKYWHDVFGTISYLKVQVLFNLFVFYSWLQRHA